MGWNCTIVVVHGARLPDLAALGWTPTAETLAWDEATSSAAEGVAALERPAGLVLASGGIELIDAVDPLGTVGPTYAGLFQSVTDTYFWELAGGPQGRRSWQWSAYEQIADTGTPHPAEAGIERLDEDALFDLLAAGGLGYDAALEDASFTVLDTGAPSYDEPRPKRRKRFGIF